MAPVGGCPAGAAIAGSTLKVRVAFGTRIACSDDGDPTI